MKRINTMKKSIPALLSLYLILFATLSASAQGIGQVNGPKKKSPPQTTVTVSQRQKSTNLPPSPKSEQISNKINGHEYVDLGLPSGLLWATCNVGANKPEEFGDYYAWGETNSHYNYSTTNNKAVGNITGSPTFDVARVKWGGSWRCPTRIDFIELKEKCNCEWTIYKNVKGYKITGLNGKSIFLPANISIVEPDNTLIGYCGNYWSSAPYDSKTANSLFFDNVNFDIVINQRNQQKAIRPVIDR